MNVLLHTCCASCLIIPCRRLREEDFQVSAFFYNPNIMPYREFRHRLTSFRDYASENDIPYYINEDYQLRFMLEKLLHPGDKSRCRACYDLRLFQTARFAAEKGFEAFSTTLSVSPYQDHEAIRKSGREAAEKWNVEFLYRDWRPEFRKGIKEAKQDGDIYLQGYCGCIFSEEERYRPSVRKKIARKMKAAREKSVENN